MSLIPYQDNLPKPAVKDLRGKGVETAIEMPLTLVDVQYSKQLPKTQAWGYDGTVPGPTIMVDNSQTVHVKWKNQIKPSETLPYDVVVCADAGPQNVGDALPTDCKCSPQPQRVSLNPPQNEPGQDQSDRDDAASSLSASIVTHLHGGLTSPDSDGWAENVYPYGRTQFATYGKAGLPAGQRSTLLWYHDHGMGVTRLNVYAGLFGLWVIRDEVEKKLIESGLLPDEEHEMFLVIQDRNFDLDAPDKFNGKILHKTETSTAEMFGPYTLVNGKLWPKTDVNAGPTRLRILNGSNSRTYCLRFVQCSVDAAHPEQVSYTPIPAATPLPVFQVGSDGGLLRQPVDLSEPVRNVNPDDSAPFPLTLTLAPAERADVVVDFSKFANQQLAIVNTAFAPFHGSTVSNPNRFNGDGSSALEPDQTLTNPDPQADPKTTTIQPADPGTANTPEKYLPFRLKYPHVLQLNVIPDRNAVPLKLKSDSVLDVHLKRFVHSKSDFTDPNSQALLPANHQHRWIALDENPTGNLRFRELVAFTTDPDEAAAAPGPLIPICKMNGVTTWYKTVAKGFHDAVSFFVESGGCEIWNILNLTGDTHPIHVHLVQFQIMSRQRVDASGFQTPPGSLSAASAPIKPVEIPQPPDDNELGLKDTVRSNPGEIVQIAAIFDGYCGKYMYHCHILEHEDHDMMRPFVVVAKDAFGLMGSEMPGMRM